MQPRDYSFSIYLGISALVSSWGALRGRQQKLGLEGCFVHYGRTLGSLINFLLITGKKGSSSSTGGIASACSSTLPLSRGKSRILIFARRFWTEWSLGCMIRGFIFTQDKWLKYFWGGCEHPLLRAGGCWWRCVSSEVKPTLQNHPSEGAFLTNKEISGKKTLDFAATEMAFLTRSFREKKCILLLCPNLWTNI